MKKFKKNELVFFKKVLGFNEFPRRQVGSIFFQTSIFCLVQTGKQNFILFVIKLK